MTSPASLRRRFLLSFAGLLGGLAALSLALSVGLLLLTYRSTVDERIREVGARLEEALRDTEAALLFRTRILADVGRIEAMGLDSRAVREIQVHTLRWLKRDGLQVVGMGSREYWDHHELPPGFRDRVFNGVPSVELLVPGEGPPLLMGGSPREGAGGVAEAIVAALPLDGDALHRLARQSGGEVALYDRTGALLASSLAEGTLLGDGQVPAVPLGQVADLTLGGSPYAYRNFRLEFGQRPYGVYTVLWPVSDLRALTWRLALWHLGGVGLGFALFYFLYRRIIASTTDDVDALAGWAHAFAPDQPTAPPCLERTDEVGVLARAFAGLVRNLEEAVAEVAVKNRELEAANASLEIRVQDKTREVENQRRLFETVLSGMAQSVFLVAPEGTVAYANPAALQAFGPVAGRPCASLWDRHGPCQSAAPVVTELTREGSTYLVSFTPLEGAGGGVLVAQDVTVRRELEQQLLQSQKLESVGRLAAGVAHDFNNVLGAIVPCVEMLRRRVPDSRSLTYLNTIDAAAVRATEVVRQLLAFSRAGETRRVALDLNRAVEGALQLLRSSLKGVDLVWHPGQDLPEVVADETQLQQVVLNLALNARDAMGGQGRVTVETRTVGDGRSVLLAVEDTGPGIPPELADKIFDPFFTTKEVGQGTGLGLSLVYGIVERHGGRIRALSPPGRGARFEVEIPAFEAGREAVPRARAAGLLADHDPLLL